MRYPADHKEKTRARILEAAGRVFRRLGYHASGVDRVMEEAGLTSGGFYSHFASKEELLAEVLTTAGAEATARHDEALGGLEAEAWVAAFLGRYLGAAHREAVEDGCPLAALISEVARAGDPVKANFGELVGVFARWIEDRAGLGEGAADGRVLASLAMCVGGLALSRAVGDEPLAEQILAACADQARGMLRGRASSEVAGGAAGRPQGAGPARGS